MRACWSGQRCFEGGSVGAVALPISPFYREGGASQGRRGAAKPGASRQPHLPALRPGVPGPVGVKCWPPSAPQPEQAVAASSLVPFKSFSGRWAPRTRQEPGLLSKRARRIKEAFLKPTEQAQAGFRRLYPSACPEGSRGSSPAQRAGGSAFPPASEESQPIRRREAESGLMSRPRNSSGRGQAGRAPRGGGVTVQILGTLGRSPGTRRNDNEAPLGAGL